MAKKITSPSKLSIAIAMIFSFFFFAVGPVIAEQCQLDSMSAKSPLRIPLHTSQEPLPLTGLDGVAYATGDCRENCRDWGNSVNSESGERLYNSYQYTAWDTGLRICAVSSQFIASCPSVSAGTVECDY